MERANSHVFDRPPYERDGRYINAPVWPWVATGWMVGSALVLLFVLAWSYS